SSPVPSWIKRRLLVLCAVAAALPAFAQDPAAAYPKRPIRVVIDYSAGGGSDIVPRLVLERVAAKWGQPFLVENRPGASGHIATEIVLKGGAVVTGMLAGDVDCGFYTVGGLLPYIRSGRLRALAVGGEQRNPALPDVPTFNELLPGMVSATWFAMLAPPKTPGEIVAKLNGAIVEALRQPEVQRRLAEMHADV